MELVNSTPLPADVTVTTGLDPEGTRIGMIVAKATFTFGEDGVEPDTQDPYALFDEDEETELGLLPADLLPRRDPAFEVVLLGVAHAPEGRPVPSMTVRLSVGARSRSMAVFGDRWWNTYGQPMEPEPFARMPLTWNRAFGGTAEAWFDEHTSLDVRDPMNPLGRGFDAEARARELAEALEPPETYPRLEDRDRPLPNLEAIEQRIASPTDAPDPECWATVPMDIGFSQIRTIREIEEHGRIRNPRQAEVRVYHRAHPDWVTSLPEAGAPVRLEGLTPEGITEFRLPRLRVLADYVLGDRTGTRELRPHLLALLPEERRFYLVFREAFTLDVDPSMERSFRLRRETGWFPREGDGSGAERGENPTRTSDGARGTRR